MLRRLRLDPCWLYGGIYALYLACPYHLLNGYMGPLFDRRAIFAVLGMLLGCALHRAWLNRTDPQSFSSICRSSLFNGALLVLSIITVGVEFLDYPMYLAGDVESSAFLFQVPSFASIVTWYVLDIEPYVVLLGASFSVFGFLCSHDAAYGPSADSPGIFAAAPVDFIAWAPAISIVLGIAVRLAWTVFLPPTFGSSGSLEVILSGCVSIVLALALSLLFLDLDRATFVSLRCVAESKFYGRISYAQMLVFCMSSGQLIATVVMRYAYDRIAGLATLLVLLALLAVILLRVRRSASAGEQDGSNATSQITDLLRERYGLSPREALFASGVLLGKSGKEIALDYEVKPGTVRSTLFRTYQKMGVHGERELRDQLMLDETIRGLLDCASQSSLTCDEASSPHEHGRELGFISRLLESAGIILCLHASLYVLFPVQIVGGLWGVGQLPLVGVVLALIGTGLFGVAFEVVQGLGFCSRNLPSDMGKIGLIGRVLGAFIILAAVAFCLSYTHGGELVHALGSCSDIVSVVSYSLVAIMALALVSHVLGSWNRISAIQIAVSFALWAIFSRFEAWGLVLVEAALGILFLSFARVEGGFARYGEPSGKSDRLSGVVAYEVALCSLFAFCFEEWWRTLGQQSYLIASIPLFVSLAAAYLVSYRRWLVPSASVPVACIACLFTIMVQVAFGEPLFSMLPCSLIVLFVFLGGMGLGRMSHVSRFFAGCVMAGSLIVVNKIQDFAVHPPSMIGSLFGSGENFSVAVGAVLSVMSLFAGVFFWHFAREAWEMRESHAFDIGSSSEESGVIRRQKALLVSRGLSDVQTEIMLLTARGETARNISDRVCYSPATVKALRTASYRQLRVRDRAGLIKLMSQVDDM